MLLNRIAPITALFDFKELPRYLDRGQESLESVKDCEFSPVRTGTIRTASSDCWTAYWRLDWLLRNFFDCRLLVGLRLEMADFANCKIQKALSYEYRTILNVRNNHFGAVRVLSQVPEKLKQFLSGVPTEHLPFEYWHGDSEFESSGLSVVCLKAVSNATSERFNSKAKNQLLIGKNFGQQTLQAKLFLRSVKAVFKDFFKTLVQNNCLEAYKAARRYVKSTTDHNKTMNFFEWND